MRARPIVVMALLAGLVGGLAIDVLLQRRVAEARTSMEAWAAEQQAAAEFLEARRAELYAESADGADVETRAKRAAALDRAIDRQRQFAEVYASVVPPSEPGTAQRLLVFVVGALAAALAVAVSAALLGAWVRRLGGDETADPAAARAEEALS